jgi:putative SOS response-associated peptidase YedK
MIFGLVSKKEVFTRKFGAIIPDNVSYIPNYNLRPSESLLFLSSAKPYEFANYRFGMTPSWSKDERVLYEAPVENGKRQTHDVLIKKDIILSQDFRKPIREQRGLFPVDYFIVESEEGKPYVIFLKNKKRPIALACVWDAWKKEILDNLVYGFSVVTVPVFGEFAKVGIKQIPLILTEYHYKTWLKTDSSLSQITPLLNPYPENYLNAYPISNKILTCTDNERELIEPIGELLVKEEKTVIGYQNHGRRKTKDSEEKQPWGERMGNSK